MIARIPMPTNNPIRWIGLNAVPIKVRITSTMQKYELYGANSISNDFSLELLCKR